MKAQKKVLAAVVAMAIGGFAAGQAQANESLLFPYYKTGNGVFTFLSLFDAYGKTAAIPANLHYTWQWKQASDIPAGKTIDQAQCRHTDAFGSATKYDLVQDTVSPVGQAGGAGLTALFGDASKPAFKPVSPAEGFMIVEDITAVEGDFYGQAIVIDTSNGMVAAYKGLNNPVATSPADFTNSQVSKSSFVQTWYPTTAAGSKLGAAGVNTTWFTIVTGLGMNVDWTGEVLLDHGFALGTVYDRDENPLSGNITNDVVCFASLTTNSMLNIDQQDWTKNGGMNWSVVTPVAVTGATGAMMVKIESTTQLGGKSAISLENAFPNFAY